MKRVRARKQQIRKAQRHRKLTSPVTIAAVQAAMKAGDDVAIIQLLDLSPSVGLAILAAKDDDDV